MPAREQSQIAGIFANRWIHVCLIIVAGALIYANSLSGPLVFDDQSAIRFNPQIRRLWPLSEPLTPPQNTPATGRPLVNLSFAINYAIGGLEVRGFAPRTCEPLRKGRRPAASGSL